MPASPSPQEIQTEFATLVDAVRAGVLITTNAQGPFGSHVPFLLDSDWTQVHIHISQLAAHTKNLSGDRRVALFLAEPDRLEKNPLALKRVNLQGHAQPVTPESPRHEDIKRRYIQRFPQSAMTFQLADFQLWTLEMATAHFVAGFGRAYLATKDDPSKWVHQGP